MLPNQGTGDLTQNNLETQILGPIFLALAYAIPFCSTLWFYRSRRIQRMEKKPVMTQVELSGAQVDVDNHIELIKQESSLMRTEKSNLTNILMAS